MFLKHAIKLVKPWPISSGSIRHVGKAILGCKKFDQKPHKYLLYSTTKYLHDNAEMKTFNPCTLRNQNYATLVVEESVDSNVFETVCEETLNSLADYFDDLIANESKLAKADATYGVGVLTIDLGSYGTYVINRQSPNKQIWLSSPLSGPKRFDYLVKEDCWVYKHDGQTLHSLLKQEFEEILGKELQLSDCAHSHLDKV